SSPSIVVLILTHGSTVYDERLAEETRRHVEREMQGEQPTILISHRAFEGDSAWGHYAVWPLIPRISARFPSLQWLIVMEVESRMDGRRLRENLKKRREEEELFVGRGMVDQQPVITHHFYGFDSDDLFQYPDFAAGVLLSGRLVSRLSNALQTKTRSDFTIDPKHEVSTVEGPFVEIFLCLQVDHFCQSDDGARCLIWFQQRTGHTKSCTDRPPIGPESLFVAIKTFSGFHRTRVVVAKRTWVKNVRHVVFYSDLEDERVPTKTLGIPNTERGHCGKTIAILKNVVKQPELSTARFLLIADDDTLVGLSRLYRWLKCYDDKETMIIGERYGYGYGVSGEGGYDYPTGGAGMVFSLPAVRLLAEKCECPSIDSPDDMILGMCARRLGIPLVHSPAMHQARPSDYPRSFLSRLPPVSFHKHDGEDPYEVFTRYLR
ncbi:hypothetical protein PFISCL1PPCAC_2670, partial [Pristionchus fissidentatus]